MLLLLRTRAKRHPAITRFIGALFLGWLLLFVVSSWIDLFQGFEAAQVALEFVQGLTTGCIVAIILGVPAWFLLTSTVERMHPPDDPGGPRLSRPEKERIASLPEGKTSDQSLLDGDWERRY